jgi:hypothetical protein
MLGKPTPRAPNFSMDEPLVRISHDFTQVNLAGFAAVAGFAVEVSEP